MSADKGAGVRERVSALSESARRSLAAALAGEGRAGAGQLVAYLVVEPNDAPPTEEELRTALAERLPPYMIPARFAVVGRLPRTAAGKLDRRALEWESGGELRAAGRAVVAPRTPDEATLAAIWREVLRVDEISVHDDFFEIGGDSLLSIRVIARAGRAGLQLPVERFFERPTIAHLAALAQSANGAPRAGPPTATPAAVVTGEAPPTPIQHWFLDAIGEHRGHWNQSYLLGLGVAVDGAALERVVLALVAHHDALRLRLVEKGGAWRQELPPVPERAPLRTVDLSAEDPAAYAARVAAEGDVEHAALRLTEGALFRCVAFAGAGGWRRLLVLAHHALVDDVSWDVLLEDLATLLDQAARGEPLLLPAKTASVLDWATGLASAAARADVAASARHWLCLPSADEARVPVDLPNSGSGNRAGDAVVRTVALDEGETDRLLGEGPSRLEATPQALLLGAVLLAWRDWTGEPALLLDLEGHGRDVLGDGLDVSRTIGWFTTVFPVWLAVPADRHAAGTRPRPADVVRAVQAALAALPLRGAAHGLLRWLSPDASLRAALAARRRPEVLFNYLGVRNAPFPAGAPLRLAAEEHGRVRSPEGPRLYVLEINARVEARRLILDIEYSRRLHYAASIERLADALVDALRVVGSAAPAPFALAGLDDAGLARVADLLAEVDDG